jgi:hypothetical protein
MSTWMTECHPLLLMFSILAKLKEGKSLYANRYLPISHRHTKLT